MYTYLDLLPEATKNQKAFILDHGKVKNDGELKYADDFSSYGWNLHQYGKLKEGAFVLNRHPGKITKDRKWEIYGGGFVSSISEPDADGNVTAEITHAFKIESPIKQGDSFIENFKWDTPSKKKRKKPNSWAYFWDQYGMNEITYIDFVSLIKDRHLVPIDSFQHTEIDFDVTEVELEELSRENSKDFTVLINEVGPKRSTTIQNRKFIGRKTDWDHVNKSKHKIGALGEEIVFDLLMQDAEKNGLQLPIHVSKTEGDGLGYDIRYWDGEGREIHIEVKTSKLKFSDGFEMSANEVESSRSGFPYKIYFVHDLNVQSKNCKIEIYAGPIIEESFKLVPSSYKVFLN